MEIVVEELNLEGSVTALGLEAPFVLAVSLQVGTDVWEFSDVEVETADILPALIRSSRVPVQNGGRFSISLMKRGRTAEMDALVADVAVKVDTSQAELQTTCVELEWDSKRKLWVSAEASISEVVAGGGDRAGGGIAMAAGCPRLNLSHRIYSELPSGDKFSSLPVLPCTVGSAKHAQKTCGSFTQRQLEVLAEALFSGRLSEAALQTYMDCDQGVGGFLTWDSGQVQEFIVAIMHEFGLKHPSEKDVYTIFSRFAGEDGVCLDSRDCTALSDALARHILADQAPELLRPATPPATALAAKPKAIHWAEKSCSRTGKDASSAHSSFASTLLPYSVPIAQLAIPGFDPNGWLKCSSVPSGLGEHTVLEVLNFFLDGMAAQLGLTHRSTTAAPESNETQAIGASVAHQDDDWLSVSDLVSTASPGATRARSRNHSELDMDSPAIRITKGLEVSTGLESVPSVPPLDAAVARVNVSSDSKSKDAAFAEAVAIRTQELESELKEVSAALSQSEGERERSQKRCQDLSSALSRSEEENQLNEQTCEELRHASRLAGVEKESLQSRLEGAERRSELAELRLSQNRQLLELAERERQQPVASPQSASDNHMESSTHGVGRDKEKATEVLYCLRTTMRRILLNGSECPVIPDANHTEITEVIDALRKHFAWLWRALRSLWDAQALLKDVLAEVSRTPLAIATLAASGEPPWPEAVVAPRAREAEQLLEVLKNRSMIGKKPTAAVHVAEGATPSFGHRPQIQYGSNDIVQRGGVEVATLADMVPESNAEKAALRERSPSPNHSALPETSKRGARYHPPAATVVEALSPRGSRYQPPAARVAEAISPRMATFRTSPAIFRDSQATSRVHMTSESTADAPSRSPSPMTQQHTQSGKRLLSSREREVPTELLTTTTSSLQSVRSSPAFLEIPSRSLSPAPQRHCHSSKQLPSSREAELAALRAAVAQRDVQIQELESVLTVGGSLRTGSYRPRSLSPPMAPRSSSPSFLRLDSARTPPLSPASSILRRSHGLRVATSAVGLQPHVRAVVDGSRGQVASWSPTSPRVFEKRSFQGASTPLTSQRALRAGASANKEN